MSQRKAIKFLDPTPVEPDHFDKDLGLVFVFLNNSIKVRIAEISSIVQDDDITNAGRGSNLTEDGAVECDASIMDGLTGAFGAVGAAPGASHETLIIKRKRSRFALPVRIQSIQVFPLNEVRANIVLGRILRAKDPKGLRPQGDILESILECCSRAFHSLLLLEKTPPHLQ